MADAGAIQRGSELGISELERDSFIQRQSSIRDSSQIDGDYMDMEDAASSGRASELQMSAPAIMRTFTLMCVSFSVNHACITTASGYAAADFPTSGNASNSALYSAYCVSAMFFGGAIITAVGAKKGLIGGLFLYTIYIATFFVAIVTNSGSLIIAGAAIGGLGAGFLWVCQGSYYTECSKLYASATGKDLPTVTGELGSHFATIFLSLELVFKLLAGFIKLGIPGKTGSVVVYIFFFIACVCSVFGMIACTDLRSAEERQPKAVTAEMITGKAIAAANLMVSDIRMPLMIPTQLAFAFVASFLGAYVTPDITGKALGADANAYIAFFLGQIALVAALVSYAGGKFISATGLQWPMMAMGAGAFSCVVAPFLISTEVSTYTEVWKVILIYTAMGVGRGIFESTNKAVIAGFFPDDAPAAFANIIWTNGLCSAILYSVFNTMVKTPAGAKDAAIISFIAVLCGIVCYFLALAEDTRRNASRNGGGKEDSMLAAMGSSQLDEPLRDSVSNL